MTIEINLPDIGIEEVEVTEVLVKIGDDIKEEQSLITVEGDKASIEIPAPFAGVVKELKVSAGDRITTGSPIAIFEEKDLKIVSEEKEVFSSVREDKKSSSFKKNILYNNDPYATPRVLRLAREFNVDLTKIRGSGRKGRILREDVQIYIKEAVRNKKSETTVKNILDTSDNISPYLKTDFCKFGEVEKIELNRIQKISGENLSRNWKAIPHVTLFDKVDITELELFRKQQVDENKKRELNIRITPVVFIMKVIAFALKKMPRFNSSLSGDCQYLILKKYINIGVAVDTSNGLVVPVFKDINRKGIIELSEEFATVTKKAREGKLTASEMQGGCFTISSIGKLGTTHFSPIVNAPEVAILGVSKSSVEPVWNGKEFVSRLMLPISLSFDHRVIDGADGARFITFVKETLNDIRRLLM